jgi:hypothetical protein
MSVQHSHTLAYDCMSVQHSHTYTQTHNIHMYANIINCSIPHTYTCKMYETDWFMYCFVILQVYIKHSTHLNVKEKTIVQCDVIVVNFGLHRVVCHPCAMNCKWDTRRNRVLRLDSRYNERIRTRIRILYNCHVIVVVVVVRPWSTECLEVCMCAYTSDCIPDWVYNESLEPFYLLVIIICCRQWNSFISSIWRQC